jgi:hypothetical protein
MTILGGAPDKMVLMRIGDITEPWIAALEMLVFMAAFWVEKLVVVGFGIFVKE